MAQRYTLEEIRTRTYKSRDAWWTVWLVDPLAARLVWLVAPVRSITPNALTFAAFLFGVGAAACFWQGGYGWVAAGALLFHLSFVIDCMDGKIARLKGTGSVFGAWLDYVFDRLRVLVCTIALMGGQYVRTGNFVFVWLAGLVIFLDMFRYLNALQMSKVKADMREKLATVTGPDAATPVFLEDTAEDEHPVEATTVTSSVGADGVERPVVDVYSDFRTKFSRATRVRNFLVRHRVRAHLFSGIEFQMAVFIVGPLVAGIVPVTVAAAVLLIAFELLLIYKLLMATRSFGRVLARSAAPAVPRDRQPATL